MFTFTDTEDNISGNAVTSDKVSTWSTRYESCDLTNIEECADDSDSVSKVNEPVETSTKACLVYDDVTVSSYCSPIMSIDVSLWEAVFLWLSM